MQNNAKSDFRLLRYFSIAGLIAFLAVAAVLYVLERHENEFFRNAQLAQRNLISQLQASYAREQDAAARRDLLLVHEAGHVNMTRLLANAMWATHIAPFIFKTEKISTEHCHAQAKDAASTRPAQSPDSMTACFAEVGNKIAALPEFPALDAKVAATIRASTVFKVKVFDRRGITVYSTERAQVGEDKYNNKGWRMAAGGHPASELTHRDKFSAFEGVVENRDLISSYVPVYAENGSTVLGVFEIYSDVTPFLAQIKNAASQLADRTNANQAALDQMAADTQKAAEAASRQLLLIVGILLIGLYAALLLIVRHAQRILDAQAQAQAQFIQREERWHHEKMSALSAMAATVAHEIGNPLATISALAENFSHDGPSAGANADSAGMILEQVQRIAAKTRQMEHFAATRSESMVPVDVNEMVKAVCDFLAFDRDFQIVHLQFTGTANLPACVIVPDHLTEALMNLLQAYVEQLADTPPERGDLRVETLMRGTDVVVRITSDAMPAEELLSRARSVPRLTSVRRRVAAMGGRLGVTGKAVEIVLPPPASAPHVV